MNKLSIDRTNERTDTNRTNCNGHRKTNKHILKYANLCARAQKKINKNTFKIYLNLEKSNN